MFQTLDTWYSSELSFSLPRSRSFLLWTRIWVKGLESDDQPI